MLEITDRVTVIRDGRTVGTIDTKDVTAVELGHLMVGRDITLDRKPRPTMNEKKPVLIMKNVNAKDDRDILALKNFSLTVNSGEIVGVAWRGWKWPTRIS